MQYIGLLYQTQGDFEGDLENFILNSLVFYDKSILKVKVQYVLKSGRVQSTIRCTLNIQN